MLNQDVQASQGKPALAPDGLTVPRQIVEDQLSRELAEIEAATVALRQGEPALESWSKSAVAPTAGKPRPVWLIVGVLWLSTAIITAGAVVAIATFAG